MELADDDDNFVRPAASVDNNNSSTRKSMELSSAGCADCCSDCTPVPPACCATSASCCEEAACCETNCQLLPSEQAISYEYHEPEENFVSIDDAKIKSLLLKIGQQQQQQRQQLQRELQQEREPQRQQQQQQQQPIIELLDDDETAIRCSPDIQLIPKPVEQHRIVARIELSDSECDEEEQETIAEKELPLSCELRSSPAHIIVLQSDDEEQTNLLQPLPPKVETATKKRPTRPYVKRRGRNFYQCQACGKKVQSNYNLRRHMMIHTGERPFPCDLCERRFREFSDLKKHRRRHMNDPRYICMICHLYPPMEQDSTRCVECEGKNLLLNPQDCEDGPEVVNAVDKDDDDDEEAEPEAEPEQAQETDQEEGDDTLMSPPPVATTLIAPPSPLLVVTLVPSLPTPPPSASVTISSIPRSYSSANSSSSLSNETTLVSQLPARTSRNRRSYPCPLCHRPFGTRHNLKRHYMIHTGEKPFSCTKCRKPFRECSTLKKHMVTHVRERWYKCLRCPAKYKDYLHYTSHKATHGSETPLELGSVAQHRVRSSDSDDGESSLEDWLECCECQSRFTRLDAYTAHLKQHDLELYGMSVDDVEDDDQEVEVA
ncbi:transcription factor E4F1 isoform X2 [Drosophila albomicans]|uniref:Transcription factor E4F1 isoform X2 n=1 Tax=Drosophila albomicans TaxID=7291 RepID=A0A6P8WLT2_DROAB|nr:transcription factor E4F1 isoform X2 [Drosophila albomicans]